MDGLADGTAVLLSVSAAGTVVLFFFVFVLGGGSSTDGAVVLFLLLFVTWEVGVVVALVVSVTACGRPWIGSQDGLAVLSAIVFIPFSNNAATSVCLPLSSAFPPNLRPEGAK